MMSKRQLQGFTLVEMIVVIVITGIIGGMVAMFLRAPVQGYVDSARRAGLTDIADTATRRISRDLHLALPNSVRVTGACGAAACFVEFIPTIGGGRYRADTDTTDDVCPGGNTNDDILSFDDPDTCFEVIGAIPPGVVAGDQIVVYNLGISDPVKGTNAYDGNTTTAHNRRAVSAVGAHSISITSANALPFDSCVREGGIILGGCRFQVVQTPVTYAFNPVARTLSRWQGYAIQSGQPTTLPAAGSASILATNVTACTFTYDAVSQRSGLVTMHLTISDHGEDVTLYSATHVNNVP
ncbi:MAG: prepilin-type N-terminal cleavage/methylation domain-containing protein [Sideroxyarcus sp.]|nr:prepilin-type N-terminal cleavage/methylation domain-containing protein [Sideroxyarcus sp.]